MNRFHLSVRFAVFAIALLYLQVDHAAAQEVGLVTLDMNEVARGYRAEALKLQPVNNDKGEAIGKISDFIFGKDGSIFVVLAVGDFIGLNGHLVAVPFRSLKLDDPPGNQGYIVLPGASRAALEKLPVFLFNR
jgi:PRC-barrel domain protein